MRLTRTQVRGFVGLVAALTAGIGLLLWLSNEAQEAEHAARADRLAIVRARMVADVVMRAGGSGHATREAIARLARADAALVSVRVVRLDGATLEASTVPADTGDRAAPRRLEPPEKWIDDLGRALQAARATNLGEGAARKDEILVVRDSGGRRRVAAPIDTDGVLSGYALVETAEELPSPATTLAPAVPTWFCSVLLFQTLSWLVRDSRWGSALLGSLLLAAALGTVAWFTTRTATHAWHETAGAVGELTARQATVARAALPSDTQPYDLAGWDVDRVGRPRGLVQRDGGVDPATVMRGATQAQQWMRRRALGVGLGALLLFLGVAVGLAGRAARKSQS